MKRTKELYGVGSIHFKGLPYENALKEKMRLARERMQYYKTLADAEPNKFGGNYEIIKAKYLASSRAYDFNSFLLEELEEIQ